MEVTQRADAVSRHGTAGSRILCCSSHSGLSSPAKNKVHLQKVRLFYHICACAVKRVWFEVLRECAFLLAFLYRPGLLSRFMR